MIDNQDVGTSCWTKKIDGVQSNDEDSTLPSAQKSKSSSVSKTANAHITSWYQRHQSLKYYTTVMVMKASFWSKRKT